MSSSKVTYHDYVLNGITFRLPSRYIPHEKALIGSGTYGVVIKAHDKISKQDVAIKKLINPFSQPHLAKRTHREFVLSRMVNHKNVIQLIDAFTPQSSEKDFFEIYFVSDYVRYSLRQIIAQREKIFCTKGGGRKISFLIYQLLCGINHLHKAGIIHRDITPANILVSETFTLKIIDLGLARQIPENKQQLSGYVVMRYYRAPEVVLNVVYNEKVDVWSVGCILAELLTGDILFHGKDHIDQWMKIIEILGTPNEEFLQKLPESVQHFLRKINRYEARPFKKVFLDNIFPPCEMDLEVIKQNGKEVKREKPKKPYCTAENGRDFLSKILVIDPEHRMSVEQALKHPYVEEKHEAGELDAEPRPDFSYIREIDNLEMPPEDWRNLIFEEIKTYEIERTKMTHL